MKEKLTDLLLISSAHGLPRIIRAQNMFIKAIWTISLLASTSCCLYFICRVLFAYFEYEVVVNMDVKYETQSEFPSISICNPDLSLDNINILRCNFNTYNYTSYFEPFYDPYYNKCYRFNNKINSRSSKKALKATYIGTKYGLQLDLIVNTTNEFNELYVFIHNYSLVTSTLLNKGFHVTSGTISYFLVDRLFTVKLDSPYSACLKNPIHFKMNKTLINHLIYNLSSIYTYKECFRLCRNLFVMEKSGCNCSTTYDNAASCSKHPNQTLRDCYNKYVADFQLSTSDGYNKCENYCPYECDSYNFVITPLVEQLPSTGAINSTFGFNYAFQFENFEQVKRTFFSIYVYYEDLKYTLISDYPKMETFYMASSIGGTFGLFLGISFLSFIEIIEFLYEFIVILFNNKVNLI